VRNAAGREDEPAGSGREVLVADLEDVLPFEHVEELASRSWTCKGVSASGGTSSKSVKAPPVVSDEARIRIVTSPNTRRSPASGSSASSR
jgi:hypothetical protein